MALPLIVCPPIDPVARFETWWQARGQYGRAGGGDYEKTFAYNAWCAALDLAHAGTSVSDREIERLLKAAREVADFEAIPLKCCPFCGPGQSTPGLFFDDVAARYRVGCGRCGTSTGFAAQDRTPAPAIRAWNTRG